MSSARRAYDLVRGYVNREFERISELGKSPEEAELDEAIASPAPRSASSTPVEAMTPEDERALACKILGVEPSNDFGVIRKAYEQLNSRSDPGRFPESSPERAQALAIQRRIQWAYRKMIEGFDTTEMRFRTLEID